MVTCTARHRAVSPLAFAQLTRPGRCLKKGKSACVEKVMLIEMEKEMTVCMKKNIPADLLLSATT